MVDSSRMRFVGRPILRREDRRLLTGQGQFVADIVLPRMLHVAFVRSPVAHARIRNVDASRAAQAPDVALVVTGAELAQWLPPAPDAQLPLPSKWRALVEHRLHNPQQPLLAADKVRHVGEAIAVVVAESPSAALDAAELIEPELEPLPAVLDPEQAVRAGGTLVHERFGTNLIGEFTIGKGAVDAALDRAPKRLKRRFYHHRYSGVPMECRGVIGMHDPRTDAMTIWSSTQVVHWVRREAATILGLPESRVRCVAPDVGGGFGVKGHVYPEDLLIPFLARKLGRPVRWLESRSEHFLSATQSRDQIHDVDIGFDESGRILALRDDYLADCGAYNLIGAGVIYNTAAHLLGPYKIEHFSTTGRIAATNKVPSAAYRGAGRPEASFAVERSIDLIATELGLEPADVRLRNMVRADEMPYSVGLPYRDGTPIVYDSGDFPSGLRQAIEALGGVEAFRRRQHEARSQGRYLGLGIGCYTEGTGVGPFESATVRIDGSGKVFLAGGSCPQGQGMETIFAQVVADAWSVTPDDVVVSLADTAAIATGFGTIASRSTVTLSAAIHHASQRLREKVLSIAAHLLECSPADLELRDGGVGIVGVPARTLPLARIAQAARPGWDHGRPEGVSAGLEETFHFEPPTVTWSSATHAAVVEVDIETGLVKIEKYAVAHDCGTVVNPLLLEGQITGGAAQGLGGILLEGFVYDREGQLLTGSLMDYALPRADDMPDFQMIHLHSPSPLNPLGVKGVGEGGAIGPPAAIANAVADALSPFGAEFNETPLKPERIVAFLRQKIGDSR